MKENFAIIFSNLTAVA